MGKPQGPRQVWVIEERGWPMLEGQRLMAFDTTNKAYCFLYDIKQDTNPNYRIIKYTPEEPPGGTREDG